MSVDDAYTKALLHMDGADASTTFTDESGKTWTAAGNAQIDTAQYKFGGASGLFDGTGDYISTPDHADFDVGAGDFTVELFIRFSTISNVNLYTKRANIGVFSPVHIGLDVGGPLYFRSSANGTSWGVQLDWNYTTNITTGNWYHVAAVRHGNVWNLYLDGVSRASVTVSQTVMTNVATPTIGASADGNNSMNGWIDEFRFSKGIARWTANFTPPGYPYSSGGSQVIWWS